MNRLLVEFFFLDSITVNINIIDKYSINNIKKIKVCKFLINISTLGKTTQGVFQQEFQ